MSFPALLERHGSQAARVALVVGSLLLLINQHDAVLGETALRLGPAALTYCVPFCVFLYGKRTSDLGASPDDGSGITG